MKTNSYFRKYCVLSMLIALLTAVTACRQAESQNIGNTDTSAASSELRQTPREKHIAKVFALQLEGRHVSRIEINEEISKRAFGLYFKALDPMKLYFNKSDVEAFRAKYENTFALLVKIGDLRHAFEIYNTFIARLDERCGTIQKILDSQLDFNEDEYIIRDKKLLDYPQNDAEVYDRLKKKIKLDILALEADQREEAKKAEESKTKENKDNKETDAKVQDGVATAESADKVKKPEEQESPIQRLHRRYSGLSKRIHQTTNDDVLESCLTAVANAYDPHSSYMSPKTYENFRIQMSLNLEGIGATLGWDDGYTIVKSLVKGGAADKQGDLKVEDKIISVAQGDEGQFEDVVDMNLNDVVSKIRGKRATVVRLEVLRQGQGKKVVRIVREKIELDDSAAQGKVFEVGKKADGTPYKIGVIDLPSFYADMEARSRGDSHGRSTTKDCQKILREFVAQNADACVVDLRFNGGGSLQEVVDLVGLFIETGTVVQVAPSEFGRDRARQLNDRNSSIEWGRPLVVLTSKFSASASEIFAGAIKDYKRGIVIGDKTTHGKGTVQPLIELADSLFGHFNKTENYGVLKVSIQGFYMPLGWSTQLTGVVSDIQLPSITNEMDGSEADSDYPLSFERIVTAPAFPHFDYVTPEMLIGLKEASAKRIANSVDFKRVMKNIEIYREIKEAKKTPLSRNKYFEELDRLNMDKSEEKEYEKLLGGEQKIVRDFYLDEVLNISADYLNMLQQRHAVFAKEKEGLSADIFQSFR